MLLKDVSPDMENYLQNECYCPGEIYDSTGFFFQLFDAEDSCNILIKGSFKNEDVTAVLCKNQIILFWMDNQKIFDAMRYDATEHNVSETVLVLSGKKPIAENMDSFDNGAKEKDLKDLLKIADAIIID